ncbi:Rv3654c family TadE-like protein [Actinomycetospora sp. TBRC 11914]|uniref:Rv3654c family TadE-like protein n=1 Tax=Actinomycetospora sp. TBRC 11914 TaxID=2729387 RepID=UPI00145F3B44|nr:flp pilus-assembly TadE/G-like family protein [Actinomycetospora sp. TBRC 11914]
MRGRWPRPRDDRGFATVVAAGVIGVVGILLGALLVLGAVVATRHRAANAADLAALAGAAESARGREPACGRAREVAERNGAVLVRCTWLGWDLQVDVARSCGCLPVGGTTTVRSRAGPVVEIMARIGEAAVTDRDPTVSSPDERPRPPGERRHGWCSRDERYPRCLSEARSPARRCRAWRSAFHPGRWATTGGNHAATRRY